MRNFTFDRLNDSAINDYQMREQLIQTLKYRFATYGYKQIRTSTFEPYDLYTQVAGTIAPDDMIKVIDPAGKVLVLRPDVTIPITRKIAKEHSDLSGELRYFYVTDVFRQSFEQAPDKERTQAGVEYFGENAPEADAEIIALAIHTLKDLGLENFKIEIGDAGFFKELASQLKLAPETLEQFKQLIQAKNMTGLKQFLDHLYVNPELAAIIKEIPLLYGHPADVLKRAMDIVQNEKIASKLQNLANVFEIIQAYDMEKNIVIDLGLINHMDYYSDIIFQGFVENIGKPILMGGRYNQLADQFGTSIPAIGFACDIDSLLESTNGQEKVYSPPNDVSIFYEKEKQPFGLSIANELRMRGYRVLTFPLNKKMQSPETVYTIRLETEENILRNQEEISKFADLAELLRLLGT